MNDKDIEMLQGLVDDGSELIFVFNRLQLRTYLMFAKLRFIKVDFGINIVNPATGDVVSKMLVVRGKSSAIEFVDSLCEMLSGDTANENKTDFRRFYPRIWGTLV